MSIICGDVALIAQYHHHSIITLRQKKPEPISIRRHPVVISSTVSLICLCLIAIIGSNPQNKSTYELRPAIVT